MSTEKQGAAATDVMVEMSFTPQVWINDYAHTADAQGETDWTAPLDQVLALCDGVLPADDSYESDDLRNLPQAPDWVQDWYGPFVVSIDNREVLEEILEARATTSTPSIGM